MKNLVLNHEQVIIVKRALTHLKIEYSAVGDIEDMADIKVINTVLKQLKNQ